MKEFFKTLIILFITTAIVIILFANFVAPKIIENNSNTSSSDTSIKRKNKDKVEEETLGEDLLEMFYQTIIRDDTNNESFGDLGDSELELDTANSEYGLTINVQVFDSNGNGTIDIDEKTPVKMSITNSSTLDYTIKNVRIDGDVDMFDDNSFSNLKTENISGQKYSFDRNRLSNSGNDEFTLKAGEECSYSFDVVWSKPFIEGENSQEYLQFNFSAYNETLPAIYFELGIQTYNFSNENA